MASQRRERSRDRSFGDKHIVAQQPWNGEHTELFVGATVAQSAYRSASDCYQIVVLEIFDLASFAVVVGLCHLHTLIQGHIAFTVTLIVDVRKYTSVSSLNAGLRTLDGSLHSDHQKKGEIETLLNHMSGQE